DAGADLGQAEGFAGRGELGRGDPRRRRSVVVGLARAGVPGQEVGRATELDPGVRRGGLALGDEGPGLGDLLGPRAMLEPGERRGRSRSDRAAKPELVLEVTLVEAGHELAGRDRVPLVDRELVNPPADLE